jgi:hypothetical protein
MNYEGDAFISYAHLDNKGLSEGQKGWVANFQRALETRVAQLVGREAQVWWDPELRGNEDFSDTLVDRLRSVASLVSILSPAYVHSRWGLRELTEFCKAAEASGSLQVNDKARLFKVLKTPVPLEQHPPELRPYLGYEFFKVDPETGRVRELSEMFGDGAQRDFWMKLDDLAHDIAGLLTLIHPESAAPSPQPEPAGAIFLAETTSDLRAERDAVKRGLQQHGYTVLPARTLPTAASEVAAMVREDLASCRMSIHIFGKTYGLVPEGAEASLPEIQSDLAAERAAAGSFSRLLWIPRGLSVVDDRQRKLLEDVRMDQRVHEGTDLLEGTLEDLQTMITSRLAAALEASHASATAPVVKPGAGLLYLIYDQRDAQAATVWSDLLFKDFEIVHPIFDGDEKDLREFHEESLRTCDGVLVLFGAANEAWLRRKLTDIQKSPGYGRTKAPPDVGICLIPPQTPTKASFKTHYATVIPQFNGCAPESLAPFVAALKAKVGGASA